jgi:hypothetical protein
MTPKQHPAAQQFHPTVRSVRYHPIMRFRSKSAVPDATEAAEEAAAPLLGSTNGNGHHEAEMEEEESTLIKTVGWISAGLGAVALGLFIGRELRHRYQFNRRTPYDFYSHSGDEQDVDFGIGV